MVARRWGVALVLAFGVAMAPVMLAAAPTPSAPVNKADGGGSILEVNEASLEYFIGLAAKLAHGDAQRQLDELKQRLDALRRQKSALLANLAEQQRALAVAQRAGKTTDAARFERTISELNAQIASVDVEIRRTLQEIERARAEEASAETERQRTQEALVRIESSLQSAAAAQRAIWAKLTPVQKREALTRLQRAKATLAAPKLATPLPNAGVKLVVPNAPDAATR